MPKLLFGTCREIIERIASDSRNDRVALPPNVVGNFSDVEAEYYYSQLLGALHQMLRACNDYDDFIDLSERYIIKFKDNEKR